MYDNTTTRMELSDSEDEEPVKVPVQEDDEGRDDVAVDVPKFGGSMDAPAVPDESVDEPAPPSPAPVFTTAPTPAPEPAVVAAIPTPTANTGKRSGISESDVGKRVTVTNFGEGVLRFFGPHHRDGKPRCGVELNSAIGINNGTVGVSFSYAWYSLCRTSSTLNVRPSEVCWWILVWLRSRTPAPHRSCSTPSTTQRPPSPCQLLVATSQSLPTIRTYLCRSLSHECASLLLHFCFKS
jgi:hypothetical protein